MDEPLSNLDAKLRVQMRTEVSRLQKRAGDDDGLRHPRPDRGDDARRPRRGDARRRAAAGRTRPASSTTSPANLFVAGLHRLAGDELHAGDDRGRHGQAAVRRGPRCPRSCAASSAATRGHATSSPASAPRRSRTPRSSATTCATSGHVLQGEDRPVESMGSELYAYFEIESEGVESDELDELAADSGAAEVPGAGTGRSSPASTPESEVERGRGGRALARHLEAAPLRPAERRAPGGRRELSSRAAMRWAIAVAAALALLALATATARGAAFTPGSAGVGDPFFPDQGNGGYDVAALRPRPRLQARARKRCAATARDQGRRDPGPEPVRPRLSRPAHRIGVRGRSGRRASPGGARSS